MISSRFLFALLAFLCVNTFAFSASKDSLIIECSRKNINEFISHKEQHKDVRRIVLKGTYPGMKWNRIIRTLSELKDLNEVIFISSNFEKLPSSIVDLKRVKELTIVGSDRFDIEEGLPLLAEMSSLKKLTIELDYPDEIPFTIREIAGLEEVVILSRELSDARIDYEKAITDLSLSRSTTTIERQENETAIKVMFVSSEEIADYALEEEEEIVDIVDEENEIMPEFVPLNETSGFALAREIKQPAMSFQRTYESFTPPVEQLDIKKEYYEVQAGLPTVIFSKCSGSQVVIPEDAFVDAEGNAVEGDVVVDYREFRDPLDFIFSGIPMTFPEDGEVSFFRSAGMFEINASQDGNEVFLKDGKEIKVNFMSVDSSDTYQFYSFADSSGKWIEDGVANFSDPSDVVNLPIYSGAYLYYKNLRRNRPVSIGVDSTLYNDRFEDLSYANANLKREYKFRRNSYDVDWKNLYEKSDIQIVKVKRSKGAVIFDVTNHTGVNSEFDRLEVQHWKFEGGMTSKEFRANYSRRKKYSDIRLIEEDGNYVLRFKNKKEITEIPATPVKAVKKKMRTTYVETEANYKRYEKYLHFKQIKFDKSVKRDLKMARKYEARQNAAVITKQKAWALAREVMNDDEKKLSPAEWEVYCDSLEENERSILNASKADNESFMRSMSVDGFGVFNCDQIQRLSKPVEVLAEYKTGEVALKNVMCTYVIDKNINAVLAYNGYRGFSPSHIAFDPGSDYVIITVATDGAIASITKADLGGRSFAQMESFTFEMNDYGTTSMGELREKLGL